VSFAALAGPALRAVIAAAALAWTVLATAGADPRIILWRLEPGATEVASGAPDLPVTVGSLLKPFLAKAWAQAHPGEPSPRFQCGPESGCWLRAGHGELGLAGALTVSCNTYFLRLAEATPTDILVATLADEGFQPRFQSARQALGLDGPDGALAIAPSALLRAYVRLATAPWPGAEPIRREVLAGLREAALTGTAANLGHGGFWAKTGTVPGANGDPVHTTGLALAVDDAGWAILARVRPGRGIEAAQALAAPIDQYRPWAPRRRVQGSAPRAATDWTAPAATVRVRLFELLKPRRCLVRNLGPAPVLCGDGYLGPAASRELHAGDHAGPGLLVLTDPGTGLERRFLGEIGCAAGAGCLKLIARMSSREYVAGVIAAELPGDRSGLRLELGAAVLRFLAQGPRYPDAEVDDSTRSAFFVGRGPRAETSLSEPDWSAICGASRGPGPSQWTSDDGGRPLSARAVWGGDDGPAPASRPAAAPSHPWTHTWSAAELEQAFGAPVVGMAVTSEDGVWVLRVRTGSGSRSFRYDQAHRLLAKVLGWGGLPSPADTVEPVPDGFRATGVGLGHRVGLSLATAASPR
jgi:hypothetical protein